MKKGRIISIVLAVVNAVLIVACTVLFLGTDREKPRFEFYAADMVYREGMETSAFLEGIRAFDNEDGDITDKIVVEKLIENRENSSVIIFYAVSDKAGNVAKCSREFAAIFLENTDNEYAGSRMTGHEEEIKRYNASQDSLSIQNGLLMQAGFWNDLEGGSQSGTETPEENDADNGGNDVDGDLAKENETENDGAIGRDAIERDSAVTDRERGEEEPEEGDSEKEETDDMEAEAMAEENKDLEEQSAPVLSLKVSEVKTAIGVAPAWVEVIGNLSDDKDSYETLFRNLNVSKYDKNQAGTYQVTVSTQDSDGNRSQAVPLTIIVR